MVDDDPEIRELVQIYLKTEGYQVEQAAGAAEALAWLSGHEADLILLDVMMPDMDGVQACMRIRQERQMPIIMLSAKTQDMDKIHGLTAGADDYITKPFNPLELIARVRSQLRRYLQFRPTPAPMPTAGDEVQVEDLIINTATHRVTVSGREVSLTPIEFDILAFLARNRGLVLSAEKIYEHVWNEPYFDSANTVMVHIRKIREKLGENPRKPRYIKTVWGVGYRLES